jgi:hypothetical protein
VSLALNHPSLDEFTGSDSSAMVAAALHILARLADNATKRNAVVAPWAWDLRLRARDLERAGRTAAATQAKIIARMVAAVALGQLRSVELAAAAADIEVNPDDFHDAVELLETAMRREPPASSTSTPRT